MIYICADDYGLCEISSMHIQQCIDEGALNKVSVFPNFEKVDLHKLLNNKNIRERNFSFSGIKIFIYPLCFLCRRHKNP